VRSSTNFPHGLGIAPAFVILMPNLAANKFIFHQSLDIGKLFRLDAQQAQTNAAVKTL